MIGPGRLRSLRHTIELILKDDVPGDLIETGVWRGGACIYMRGVLKAYGILDRVVWAADSFDGLPRPDSEHFPEDADSTWHKVDFLAVTLDEVRENFRRYGLLDDQVRFLKGWFRDTLPAVRSHTWALIRLDGDMYESTIDALRNLYPGLSPGGFVIIDDYSIENCRRAVTDFRSANGIRAPLEGIDWSAVRWRKPME
jgi:O-methyltransferase